MRINTHTTAGDAQLTRRERQIMDLIYAGEEVSARDIWQKLPDQPTYSTVRTLLAVLEEKGHLTRRLEGKAFLYRARKPREKMAASALRRLLSTFFSGSVEQAVTGLIQLEDSNLTAEELRRIERMIAQARKEKLS